MTNGVISIFKILIGTLVIIIVSSLVIEYLNMILMSSFLRGYVTKTIEKGCDLFAQETYIGEGSNKVNLHLSAIDYDASDKSLVGDKKAANINWYGTTSTSSKAIYDKLYNPKAGDYREFLTFVTSTNLEKDKAIGKSGISVREVGFKANGPWQNLNRIATASGLNAYLKNGETQATAQKIGNTYISEFVTPLNQGITYLDRGALENIVKWELVAILSNGHSSTIHAGTQVDGAGMQIKKHVPIRDYIEYSGFRVYYNTFKITDIQYDIYDLKSAESRAKFSKATGIGLNNTKKNNTYWEDLGITNNKFSATDKIGEERRYVCVANVHYKMTVAYDGVTQLKRIINFMNNRVVTGLSREDTTSYGEDLMIGDKTVKADIIDRTDENDIQFSSGERNAYQLADFNANVTYYIVR